MQCEQIRPYLDQYAEGSLPGYKTAWVVQHLAGCTGCAAEAEAARRALQQGSHGAREIHAGAPVRPQVATMPEPAFVELGAASEAVQRPVPRWLRLAAVLLIVAAAVGIVWLLLGNTAGWTPQPSSRATVGWRVATGQIDAVAKNIST